MIRLLIKDLIRSKAVIAGLSLLLIAGVIGIAVGKQYLDKQSANINIAAEQQKEHIERNVHFHGNDIGLLLYYVKFGLVNQTPKLNALSIGQRDLNNSIQSVTIRNLEAQRYDTDLINPVNLHAGNLDLGFVIIYLFPLVIISLCYNIISEEQEGGTWKLLMVQSSKPIWIPVYKLIIRFVAVSLLLLLLVLLAVCYLGIEWDQYLLAFSYLSVLYLLFWFSLSFFIVSWQKNSSFNAAILLTAWVLLTVILPATVNNYVAYRYPLPEAQQTAIAQRDGYHDKWDTDKQPTMDSFYAHYPQYKKYGIPGKAFSWLWYYAMQQMGDDESADHTKELFQKLNARNETSAALAQLIPTLHLQLAINDITRSGLQNQLRFLTATQAFHEQKRLFFYPYIFDNANASAIDWASMKLSFFEEKPTLNWLGLLLPLCLFTIALFTMAFISLARKGLKF